MAPTSASSRPRGDSAKPSWPASSCRTITRSTSKGRVLRCTPGTKDIALRGAPEGGTVEEPVADDLITSCCLTDAMLFRLHDLAGRCEAFFGAGLDIEWAFADDSLYLLQCRPMTRNR